MIVYLEGKFSQITPTMLVIDCNGIGYGVNISLNTFEKIKNLREGKIFTRLIIQEDNHILYGFFDEQERALFLQLITVNGVGSNTARMILSSFPVNDLFNIIAHGNVALLKSVKGIGEKTAQRIILELKDKLVKGITTSGIPSASNLVQLPQIEALDALAMLGFNRVAAEKALSKISADTQFSSVEDLIKAALKVL